MKKLHEKLTSEEIALLEAIKHFEEKIANQGMIVNARDEEHLERLKIMLKETRNTIKLQLMQD